MQPRPPFQPIPPAGQPVRVPLELSNVRASALEDYVRARILQFIRALSLRLLSISPAVTVDVLDAAVRDALNSIPAPDYGQVPVEALDLQLVFRHDCQSQGCLDESCALCQYNTERRCRLNFAAKYLVNDRLTARCGATIRIELLERGSGQVFEEELPDVVLEVLVLDGNAYDQKFLGEMGPPTAVVAAAAAAAGAPPSRGWDMAELEECVLYQNNRKTPLLVAGLPGAADANGRIRLSMGRGRVLLPDLAITDSSEALLTGRKPPYRLLVRALHKDGRRLSIKPAISEGFVVATRRTRSANKVEIPSMDDPVSKLEHMGRETIKKLQDLRAAASQVGVEMELGELNNIEKVSQFKALALKAEQDATLKQKLMQVLKLPKEKWDEAKEHSKRAVIADNRLRVWYQDPTAMDVGLLFPCNLGQVALDQPAGLLLLNPEPSPARFQVLLMAQMTPAQRDLVRRLQPRAAAAWWTAGHTGWSIFPVSSDTLEGSALTQAAGSDMSLSGAAAAGSSGYHPAGTSHRGAYLPLPATAPAAGAALGREALTISTGGPTGPLVGPPAAMAPVAGLLGGRPVPAVTAAAAPSLQQLMQMGQQQQAGPPGLRGVASHGSLAGSSGAAAPGGPSGGLPGPLPVLQPAAAAQGAASAAAGSGGGGHGDAMSLAGLPSPQQLDEMLANDTLSSEVVEAITRALHNRTCPQPLEVHLRTLIARQAGGLVPGAGPAAPYPPPPAPAAAAQLAASAGLPGAGGGAGAGPPLQPHPPLPQQLQQGGGPGVTAQPQVMQPPGAGVQPPGSLSELLAAGSGVLSPQQDAGKLSLQQLMLAEQQRLAAIQAGGGPQQYHPLQQQQQQQQHGMGLGSSQAPGAVPSVTGTGPLGHNLPLDQLLVAATAQQAPAAATAPPLAETSRSLSGKKRHCLSSASLESPLPSLDAGATGEGMAAALAALGAPATAPAVAQPGLQQRGAVTGAPGVMGLMEGGARTAAAQGAGSSATAGAAAAAAAAARGGLGGGLGTVAPAPEGASPTGPTAGDDAGPEGAAAAAGESLDELNPFLAQLQKEAHQQQQQQQQMQQQQQLLLQGASGALSGRLDPLLAGLPPGFSLDLAGLPLNLLPALHAGASMGAPPGGATGTTGSALATAACSAAAGLPPASTGLAAAAAFAGWGGDILPPTSDTPMLSADLEKFMSLETSLPMFPSLTMADQLLSRLDLPATLAAGVAGGASNSPGLVPSSAAALEAALGQLPMTTLPSIDFGRLMSLEMLASWPAELSVAGPHSGQPHLVPPPGPGPHHNQQQQQQQHRSPAASPPVTSGLAPTTSGLDTMQSMAEVLEQLESPAAGGVNPPAFGPSLD